VDNAYIDIDNIEVPILDGSALPFCHSILEAGIENQTEARRCLEIRKHVRHELGDKIIEVFPSPRLEVQYSIDFPHPSIGFQQRSFEITSEIYLKEIAPCRTFGFMREIQLLKENGLIKGGSLENAIVLDDEKVLNREGLRFPDEFVRHKAMDFLGDISLIGGQIIGRFNAHKAGHGIHAALVRKILSDPENYRFVSSESRQSALAV
jgi:UDP-3-O-[3-hydroxymyristoyl] N-acetylglucosamine deacetylase